MTSLGPSTLGPTFCEQGTGMGCAPPQAFWGHCVQGTHIASGQSMLTHWMDVAICHESHHVSRCVGTNRVQARGRTHKHSSWGPGLREF